MDRQQLATDNALRILPSHGWTAGWIGRRDRALIVLSRVAELPYQRIARLSAGDIGFTDGAAIIAGPDGSTTVAPSSDGLVCAPCALARWLHALDLTVVYTDTNVIASVIGRAAPLTAHSPHVCQSPQPISAATREVPALPTMDRWGILAPQPLSSRSHPRSHLTRAAGPITAHRVAAASARSSGDDLRRGVGAADPTARGPVGAGLRDHGARTTQVARGSDMTERRAGELEKRLRRLLDDTQNRDN
jgi:hypothetical protein